MSKRVLLCIFDDAYRLEMENFIDCIQKGIKPDVSVYDGTKSTQIALATKRAHAEGGILKIEY